MKLKEFIDIVNYDNFDICIDTADKGLVRKICLRNNDVPYKYLNDDILNFDVNTVFLDFKMDDKGNSTDNLECILIEVCDYGYFEKMRSKAYE